MRTMIHFDPEVIRGSEHMRGLGSSKHQIAVKRAFMSFCGISFQFKNFTDLVESKDKLFMTQFMSVPPNWEPDTWCPIMEAHPFEFSAIMLEAPFPVHGSSLAISVTVGRGMKSRSKLRVLVRLVLQQHLTGLLLPRLRLYLLR